MKATTWLSSSKEPSAQSLPNIQLVGSRRVFVDDESCFAASLDNMRLSFMPDAVVKVQATAEVGAALKLAQLLEARGAVDEVADKARAWAAA